MAEQVGESVQWVVSLSFDVVDRTARLALTVDPDRPRDDRVITFSDVGDCLLLCPSAPLCQKKRLLL